MREEERKKQTKKKSKFKKCLLATGYNQNFSHKAHTKSLFSEYILGWVSIFLFDFGINDQKEFSQRKEHKDTIFKWKKKKNVSNSWWLERTCSTAKAVTKTSEWLRRRPLSYKTKIYGF